MNIPVFRSFFFAPRSGGPGLSSWLDASLLAEGSFYPDPKMTADERLRWYARFFGLTCVAVDCPWQPFIPAATTDWAVLRFHGRNAAGWEAQMRPASSSGE